MRRFRRPIYEAWLETAVLSGALRLPSYDVKRYKAHRWIIQGQEWVDPLKDVEATKVELQLGLTSVTRVLGKRGEYLEDLLREIDAEQKLGLKYGIDLRQLIATAGAPQAKPAAPPAAADAPDAQPANNDSTDVTQ